MLENPSGYQMPKPSRIILLDDLSDGNQETIEKLQDLSRLFDSKYLPILVTLQQLIDRLKIKYHRHIKHGLITPVDIAISIGKSGQNIFRKLKLDIPEFTVYPQRITDANGHTFVKSKNSIDLPTQLDEGFHELNLNPTILNVGLVDDTVFSGETIRTVTDLLLPYRPKTLSVLTLTYIPCLSSRLGNTTSILSALTLKSSPNNLDGLNSLDTRDFVDQTAIPLKNGESLSFSDETNWMKTWFGNNYQTAVEICSNLSTPPC